MCETNRRGRLIKAGYSYQRQCLSYEKPRSSVNRAPETSQELDNLAGGKGGAVSPLLKASEMNSRQMYEL